MNYQVFREKRFREQLEENLTKIWKEISENKINKALLEKIKKRYNKYSNLLLLEGIDSFENYLSFLKQSRINVIGLEIDPKRQSFDELCQIDYLNKTLKTQIKKLPASGKNALCFNKKTHELVSPLTVKARERTKTIDADDGNVLYIFKHIGEAGGAQDNQVNDVFEQIKHSLNHNSLYTPINFCFVLSGDYAKERLVEFEEAIEENEYLQLILLE